MGKEIGQKCVTKSVNFVVLAFFSVVASSPNLSTFSNSGTKVRLNERNTKEKACFLFCIPERKYLRRSQRYD